MKSSYLVNPISLFLEEIIPEVTVPPKPNGLPIAITQSPTRALSEFPKLTGINSSSEIISSEIVEIIEDVIELQKELYLN